MNEQQQQKAATQSRIVAALTSSLNYLNTLGSILLAYALANPNAFGEMREMLPEGVRPYAPLLALAWFALVQLAKMNAIKKATAA